MASSWGERRRKEREDKLERMREQAASGKLVIREMTGAERSAWAERQREFEATATPEERDRRANAIKKQQKRNRLKRLHSP